jgi:DegV family protein with EDD domain
MFNMANKFIISTDNCADYMKSAMDNNGIYCIPLKRLQAGKEYAEVFDSEREFYNVYDEVKKGILSTTSQINPDEFETHFKKILEREKSGDIVHISLSSALSGSHNSCVIAAEEMNKTLKGRKIYAFDSLSAAGGQMFIVDKFVELRNANTDAEKAVETVAAVRETENLFFIVDDLHHLKRGGRVSAAKAFIGTLLGIKPVLVINKIGKLGVVDKTKGGRKAVEFFMDTLAKRAPEPNFDYADKQLIVIHTTPSEVESQLCEAIKAKYPRAKLKRGIVGPIIGTHAGCGAVGLVFAGCGRPESH